MPKLQNEITRLKSYSRILYRWLVVRNISNCKTCES